MRLQVFLAVRRQTVETRLDSFELLPRAEVTGDVAGACVDVPLGGVEVKGQPALLDLLGHHAQSGVGPQHGPLGECDLTLGADVNPCVVSLIPVAADAVHAEAVATGDGHGVLQQVQAYGAVEVVWGRLVSHCDELTTRSRPEETLREKARSR